MCEVAVDFPSSQPSVVFREVTCSSSFGSPIGTSVLKQAENANAKAEHFLANKESMIRCGHVKFTECSGSKGSCNNKFCLYMCPHVKTPHITEKRPKHTFHLQRSLVSAAAVSQHACFYGFYAPFQVPLPMFTTSLSDEVLLSVKPDIVTVRSRMFFTWWVAGRVHFPLTVPKKHPFEALPFAHCLVYNGAETHSTHCAEDVFFSKKCVWKLSSATECSGYCCNRCSISVHSPSVCCKQCWPPTRRCSYERERECRIGI